MWGGQQNIPLKVKKNFYIIIDYLNEDKRCKRTKYNYKTKNVTKYFC